MPPTIYSRLYERLNDLIPDLPAVSPGSTFYAPPRVEGDMAIFCAVARIESGVIELEMAHDQVVDGEDQPAPWMVFRVDTVKHEAELLAVQDEWRYEVIYSETDRPNPRRQPMNLFAVNWLTIMLNIYSAFQPVVATTSSLA